MAKTTIRDNWKDYSHHVCSLQIPSSTRRNSLVEIHRSLLDDAAFIIVEDDEVRVVTQMNISEVISLIAKRLFRGFGIYQPEIWWKKELDEYFVRRVLETPIEVLESWKKKHDEGTFDIGGLFG